MVRTARDTRSRGCVSTLSAMARSIPRAGQHLCGITVSSQSTQRGRPGRGPTAQAQSERFQELRAGVRGAVPLSSPELGTHVVSRRKGHPPTWGWDSHGHVGTTSA